MSDAERLLLQLLSRGWYNGDLTSLAGCRKLNLYVAPTRALPLERRKVESPGGDYKPQSRGSWRRRESVQRTETMSPFSEVRAVVSGRGRMCCPDAGHCPFHSEEVELGTLNSDFLRNQTCPR